MIISKIIIELIAFIIHIITFMTFWPADSEDGQIFICGIFWAFFWHCMLAYFGIWIAHGIFWNFCPTGFSSHDQP